MPCPVDLHTLTCYTSHAQHASVCTRTHVQATRRTVTLPRSHLQSSTAPDHWTNAARLRTNGPALHRHLLIAHTRAQLHPCLCTRGPMPLGSPMPHTAPSRHPHLLVFYLVRPLCASPPCPTLVGPLPSLCKRETPRQARKPVTRSTLMAHHRHASTHPCCLCTQLPLPCQTSYLPV